MARDYGNKRSSRRNSGAPHQLLVIAVTFLLGYLTASIFDLGKVSHWMNTQVLASNEVKQPIKSSQSQQAQIPPKPKFEFYTLLANEKTAGAAQPNANAAVNHAAASSATPAQAVSSTAVASAVTTSRSTTKPGSAVANAQQPTAVKVAEGKPLAPVGQEIKGNYLVQVASFKASSDAEHMKGLLILKGFNVNVVPVSQAGGNWFRVVVGPYSNHNLAQKAQIALAKTERLHGMIRKG